MIFEITDECFREITGGIFRAGSRHIASDYYSFFPYELQLAPVTLSYAQTSSKMTDVSFLS